MLEKIENRQVLGVNCSKKARKPTNCYKKNLPGKVTHKSCSFQAEIYKVVFQDSGVRLSFFSIANNKRSWLKVKVFALLCKSSTMKFGKQFDLPDAFHRPRPMEAIISLGPSLWAVLKSHKRPLSGGFLAATEGQNNWQKLQKLSQERLNKQKHWNWFKNNNVYSSITWIISPKRSEMYVSGHYKWKVYSFTRLTRESHCLCGH